MNAALEDEITSVNAIYGEGTLVPGQSSNVCSLQVPSALITLLLSFPEEYPEVPPSVLRPESVGEGLRKGEANELAETAGRIIQQVFRKEPCIYDLLEELSSELSTSDPSPPLPVARSQAEEDDAHSWQRPSAHTDVPDPPWILSEALTSKKSTFIARVAPVTDVATARSYIQHLVTTDKKASKATHNITAWRIRGLGEVTYQDCDDDGEAAAGARLLHLLQMMDAWDITVVVSRWFGGIHLGPDRFRIINQVAREAIVKGGFDGGQRRGQE